MLASGSLSTQALPGQIDAGSVVDEPVQDRVRVGWIADKLMLVLNRYLAGDDGRSPSVAVFQDFQQVVTATGIERLEALVVQDQQLRRDQAADHPPVPAVGTSQRQFGKQLRHAGRCAACVQATGAGAGCRTSLGAVTNFLSAGREQVYLHRTCTKNGQFIVTLGRDGSCFEAF